MTFNERNIMPLIENKDGELVPVAVPALADDEPLDAEDEVFLAGYFKRPVEERS